MRFDRETHTVHAAGRVWRADPARTRIEDLEMGGRLIMRTRGCVVRFESGWAASILWGGATYSSNHDVLDDDARFTEEPSMVEVGVLDSTGELRQRRRTEDGYEWHDVEPYLDDAALADLLDLLAAMPTDFDYGERPPTAEEAAEMFRQLQERYPPPEA